jgi:integrase
MWTFAGKFKITAGKSAAARRCLKCTPEALTILERRLLSPGPFVFAGKQHGRHATKLNNGHRPVLEATGFTFVIYDFRHTFATRMARAGMPLPTLAAILGHANLCSVMKYVHIGQADMDEAMDQYGRRCFLDSPAAEEQSVQ